jgi:DNA-binding transcriptional LysR family regulator
MAGETHIARRWTTWPEMKANSSQCDGMEGTMYSNRLNVFITLAQYLNFSETANQLHMAQSAVSYSILELEKELGVNLFERTKKSCALTPAGEAFLPEAYRIITFSESAKAKMNKIALGHSGVLTIGYATELMIDPLAECLREFVQKYPGVELNLFNYSSVSVSRMLAENELDFALGRYDALIKRDGLDWKFLFRDKIHVLLPAGSRLARRKAITVDQLADETILMVSREVNPGFFDVVQKLFFSKGITPIMNTISNERMSVVFKVRLGLGVTLLTQQFLNTHRFTDIVAVPLDEPDSYFDNGVAWKKKIVNPIIKLFLGEVDAYIQSLPNQKIINETAKGE